MGNKFLSDLVKADVLIHVVDISGSLDAEGQDIEQGKMDPMEDIRFLENEINYWFKDIIMKNDWSKFIRKVEQEKLKIEEMLYERLAGLSIKKSNIITALEKSKLEINHPTLWNEEDIYHFAKLLREIAKPIVIACNKIDKSNGQEMFEELKKNYKGICLPCSALAEYWLRKYDEKDIISYIPGSKEFIMRNEQNLNQQEILGLNKIKENLLERNGSTGIQQIIDYSVFTLLDQIVVYPVYDAQNFTDKDGNVLPDAHLIQSGTKLKDFIEQKIHSDLARNFIYGIDCRTKLRLGESYEVKMNDIIKVVSATKPK